MRKKILSFICIITGLALLLYPGVQAYYADYQQQKLVRQWQGTFRQLAEEIPEPENQGAENAETQDDAQAEKKANQAYMQKHMEGLLIIDKIALKLPILTGVTAKSLQLSAASMEYMARVGERGNYVIAGHRSHAYGRNFNRLDELQPGDMVEVDTGGRRYRYQVREKLYVYPEETSVLQPNGKDREISLITCHPIKNPTHRLIVKGVLMDEIK